MELGPRGARGFLFFTQTYFLYSVFISTFLRQDVQVCENTKNRPRRIKEQ